MRLCPRKGTKPRYACMVLPFCIMCMAFRRLGNAVPARLTKDVQILVFFVFGRLATGFRGNCNGRRHMQIDSMLWTEACLVAGYMLRVWHDNSTTAEDQSWLQALLQQVWHTVISFRRPKCILCRIFGQSAETSLKVYFPLLFVLGEQCGASAKRYITIER